VKKNVFGPKTKETYKFRPRKKGGAENTCKANRGSAEKPSPVGTGKAREKNTVKQLVCPRRERATSFPSRRPTPEKSKESEGSRAPEKKLRSVGAPRSAQKNTSRLGLTHREEEGCSERGKRRRQARDKGARREKNSAKRGGQHTVPE